MAAYAVIDENGIVVNAIEWDGREEWNPPEGCMVVACGDYSCQIGGSYKDSVFTPAPMSDEQLAEIKAAKVESNILMKVSLIAEATQKIVPSQTKLLLGRTLTDEETTSLNAWLDYVDTLDATDANTDADLVWPDEPQ